MRLGEVEQEEPDKFVLRIDLLRIMIDQSGQSTGIERKWHRVISAAPLGTISGGTITQCDMVQNRVNVNFGVTRQVGQQLARATAQLCTGFRAW